MKKARAVLLGGMGFPATETPWGMPQLKSRLEALGVQVLLVNWSHRQEVYNFMHDFDGVKIYAGDSLGAGSAGQYPGDLHTSVDFAAGFQPSEDDKRTITNGAKERVQIIAPNIARATCIYDPRWIDTLGLGHAKWQTALGSETKLTIIEHHGAHPDDWGWSQDVVFGQMKALVS